MDKFGDIEDSALFHSCKCVVYSEPALNEYNGEWLYEQCTIEFRSKGTFGIFPKLNNREAAGRDEDGTLLKQDNIHYYINVRPKVNSDGA